MIERKPHGPPDFDRLERRDLLASHGHHRPPAHVHHFAPAPPRFVAATPPAAARPQAPPVPSAVAPPVAAPTALSADTLTAAQFSALFRPIPTAPAMSTRYHLAGLVGSGVVRSQVFQGVGPYAGFYAYAYQAAADSGRLDSVLFLFAGTPSATRVVVGPVGGLPDPGPAAGTPSLAFGGRSTQYGSPLLEVSFGRDGLSAGRAGVTAVVISAAPPNQRLAGITGSGALDPTSDLPVVYAP